MSSALRYILPHALVQYRHVALHLFHHVAEVHMVRRLPLVDGGLCWETKMRLLGHVIWTQLEHLALEGAVIGTIGQR